MIRFNSKLTVVLLIIAHGFTLISSAFADDVDQTDFKKGDQYTETYVIATAYYSPLPNQKRYLRGNYASEIKLNGNGTHGASGKAVFSGMLAAPKSYEFGTKIWIEGLGVGSVEDRGGAIVTKGNRGYAHDRIDIWMGHGDEGLARALAWGKRTVKVKIYTDTSVAVSFTPFIQKQGTTQLARINGMELSGMTEGLDNQTNHDNGANAGGDQEVIGDTPAFELSDELESKLALFSERRAKYQKILPVESVTQPLRADSIKKIQIALRDTGYSSATPNGVMGPRTREAIKRLQEARGVEVNSLLEGYFTVETKKALIEELLFEESELSE